MMEKEILELLRLERMREPLSPSRRVREFQTRLQRIKNGEETEVAGFLLARKPPHAPMDAAYYLLSPLSPSELAGLEKDEFRTYLIVRATENTKVSGEVRPGSYVLVRGVMDAYPLGNLRMIHASSIEGKDYSDYWKDYREFALSRREVVELFERTIYVRDDMRKALIYSLYGVPYILWGSGVSQWGEGFEYTVYKHRENMGLLALWKALKYLQSSLPWELRLGKETSLEIIDPMLDIDFRTRNPNRSDMKYYTPPSKRGLVRIPKWTEKYLMNKRAIGLLPQDVEADPTDALAKISETPFVLMPWEEKPYFEENREFRQLIPNLLVTIFINRERFRSMSHDELGRLREEHLKWRRWGREEYSETFGKLTTPSGVFHLGMRFYLDARLFGAITRFYGKITDKAVKDVREIDDTILNEWNVVLDEIIRKRPEVIMKLEKEYEHYIPHDVRAQKALQIFHDLASTSPNGEVTREEFLREMMRGGFNERDALDMIERFIATGYIYEPFPGKLRLVR
ncbi:hypothetical protein E3E35_10550 [Thermococcus sp. GR7]|uniref:hypothetical protein n=1 Tax=unclassified Thermococcus TaxID=2627626 RepID=UPI0016980EE9|nr:MULTISPECIES: hypothetical protein [unclassified Thermococcus]NJE47823.1 hypothetical protein [Thermococcus sp. GR7]NJE78535.1 hypothetical protein [Thermococcus sp. GR4]NJF24024.1 hypothetical protein [Thermococcus sp. GR5]